MHGLDFTGARDSGWLVPPGYFAQVALSVVVTALLAGLVRMGIEYASTGSLSATGAWLGSGWLLGGLLAGWFVSGAMQRD